MAGSTLIIEVMQKFREDSLPDINLQELLKHNKDFKHLLNTLQTLHGTYCKVRSLCMHFGLLYNELVDVKQTQTQFIEQSRLAEKLSIKTQQLVQQKEQIHSQLQDVLDKNQHLQIQNQTLQTQLADAQLQLSKLRESIKSQLDAKQAQVKSSLHSSLSQAISQRQSAEKQLHIQKVRVEQRQQQLRKCKQKIRNLQETIQKSGTELFYRNRNFKALEDKYEKRKGEFMKLQTQYILLKNSKKTIASPVSQPAPSKTSTIEEAMADSQKHIDLQNSLKKAQARIADLDRKLELQSENSKRFHQDLEEQTKAHLLTKLNCNQLLIAKNQLEKAVERLEERLRKLQRQEQRLPLQRRLGYIQSVRTRVQGFYREFINSEYTRQHSQIGKFQLQLNRIVKECREFEDNLYDQLESQ